MPCTHYDILSFTFRNHHTQNTRTKQEKPQFSAALKRESLFLFFYRNITLIIPCFYTNAPNKADIKNIFNINFFTNFCGVKLE